MRLGGCYGDCGSLPNVYEMEKFIMSAEIVPREC